MKGDIRSIQILRGIAAMMVVFHHAAHMSPGMSAWSNQLEFGQFGVDIFFVISGFIIFISVTRSRHTPLEFVINRIIRVVPLYWLVTLVLTATIMLAPTFFKSTQVSTETLVKSLFFIPHYNLAFPDRIWPLLVPGWSLNFEAFFYTLMALAIFIDRKRIRLLLSIAIVGCVIAGIAVHSSNPLFLTYTHPILLEFLGGVYLASAYLKGRFQNAYWVAWLLPVAAISLLFHPSMYDARFGLPPILPAIAIVAGALALEGTGKLPQSNFLVLLGSASYSIYLSHLFMLGALRPLSNKVSDILNQQLASVLFVSVAFVLSALAGIAIYRLIETPLLRVCNSIKSRSKRFGLTGHGRPILR